MDYAPSFHYALLAAYLAHLRAKNRHEAPPFHAYEQERWRHFDGDDFHRMYIGGGEPSYAVFPA